MHCRLHNPTTIKKAQMFKYAARHWAHFRCWLWAKLPEQARPLKLEHVVKLLSTLHVHELERFPVCALSEVFQSYGILENGKSPDVVVVMKAAIKLTKERES